MMEGQEGCVEILQSRSHGYSVYRVPAPDDGIDKNPITEFITNENS